MKKRKRVLLSIAIATGVLSVSIIAGIVCLLTDHSPPEDGDLRVSRADIPDVENAFHYFDKAAEKLYWPEDEEEQIVGMVEDKNWDSKLVDELVERNGEVFDYLEQGLKCSHFQVPEIRGYDTPLPYLSPWRDIARLGSIRASSLIKRGKAREAFGEAMRIIKFGHMIEDCRGGVVNYLLGAAVKDIGLIRLRRMLPDTTLEPELLRGYIEELDHYKVNQKGLEYAFRLDYMIVSETVVGLTAGELKLEDLGGEGTQYPKSLKMGYFFQPNKTKRMFAQTYRTLVDNIPKTYVEAEHLELPDRSGRLGTIRLFLSVNVIGKILYEMIIPALDRIQMQKCREKICVSATQLLLAIKCHKNKTGELPQSLSELVPVYFKKIPEDDFDGKPMKYSAQQRIIYSVGHDLEDSGGSEQGELWKTEDPTFRIEF